MQVPQDNARPAQRRQSLAKETERLQTSQTAVQPAALPEVGGWHGLQAGQDGRGALLQVVDGHQHVAVAGQGATVAVIHLQHTSTGSMRLCLSPLPES